MRYMTLLGILMGVLAIIFQLAGIGGAAVVLLPAAGVVAVGIGSLTGT